MIFSFPNVRFISREEAQSELTSLPVWESMARSGGRIQLTPNAVYATYGVGQHLSEMCFLLGDNIGRFHWLPVQYFRAVNSKLEDGTEYVFKQTGPTVDDVMAVIPDGNGSLIEVPVSDVPEELDADNLGEKDPDDFYARPQRKPRKTE